MDPHDLTEPIAPRRPLRTAALLVMTLLVGLGAGASAATYALLTQSAPVAAALLELGARLRLASDPLLVYEVAAVSRDTNTAVVTHTTAPTSRVVPAQLDIPPSGTVGTARGLTTSRDTRAQTSPKPGRRKT